MNKAELSKIAKRGIEIARQCEGDWTARFALGMKQAWSEYKASLKKKGDCFMKINEMESKKTYILSGDIIIKDCANIAVLMKAGTPVTKRSEKEMLFLGTTGMKELDMDFDKYYNNKEYSIANAAKEFNKLLLNNQIDKDYISSRKNKFEMLKYYLHQVLSENAEVEELTLKNAEKVTMSNEFKMVYAVKGNTYSIKDQIKKDGGRWNGYNKYWYFNNADLKEKYDLEIKFIEK